MADLRERLIALAVQIDRGTVSADQAVIAAASMALDDAAKIADQYARADSWRAVTVTDMAAADIRSLAASLAAPTARP